VLYRIYVDEAGDRGISAASSKYFVVSGVVVADEHDAAVRTERASLAQALGRQPGQVLHYRKLTHPQKVKAAQDIGRSGIATIVNVIIHRELAVRTRSLYFSLPTLLHQRSFELLSRMNTATPSGVI
jgi:hypothetical protein